MSYIWGEECYYDESREHLHSFGGLIGQYDIIIPICMCTFVCISLALCALANRPSSASSSCFSASFAKQKHLSERIYSELSRVIISQTSFPKYDNY